MIAAGLISWLVGVMGVASTALLAFVIWDMKHSKRKRHHSH